jgi:acetyl esterase/lipase
MNRKILLRGVSMLVAALVLPTAGLNSQLIVRAQGSKPQTAVYGKVGNQELTLDVYQPTASDAPLPAVILIHGGAGSFGDRSDLSEDAVGLAAAGYVAFNIDYRLLGSDGSNVWPAQLDDSQLAVRWIRANATKYNVDPDRICALGHSFGGQLAALLGMRDTPKSDNLALPSYSSRVACVIAIAASTDPTQPELDASAQPLVTNLMGGTPKDVPERYRDASPLAQVNANTVPFLIFHGADDEGVSIEQSRSLVDALHKAGVEVVYVEYPHATHFSWLNFFKPGDHWNKIDLETLAFLQRHLHRKP